MPALLKSSCCSSTGGAFARVAWAPLAWAPALRLLPGVREVLPRGVVLLRLPAEPFEPLAPEAFLRPLLGFP